MPKIISKNEKLAKRPWESFSLLLIGIMLAGFIYGGLNIFKLRQENQTLAQKQTALEAKLSDLQDKFADNQNQLANDELKIAELSNTLDQNKQQLAYYKKMVLSLQDQAKTQTPVITAIATTPPVVKPAIKTVTKKVYVKEKVADSATVTVQGVGSYKVETKADDTAFDILFRASKENNFKFEYQQYDFGVFVTSIAGIAPAGNQYWSFYYNGQYAQVGASDQKISNNDTTFWELASF